MKANVLAELKSGDPPRNPTQVAGKPYITYLIFKHLAIEITQISTDYITTLNPVCTFIAYSNVTEMRRSVGVVRNSYLRTVLDADLLKFNTPFFGFEACGEFLM